MTRTLQELNMLVSGAIFRAEHCTPGTTEAEDAYREVSRLEEEIAHMVGHDALEGAVARVGAVDAALRAGDWLRAAALADLFATDAPAELQQQLRALGDEADEAAMGTIEPRVHPVPFVLAA